jgi:D-alanyl-D-alanine carboxypeptidase
MICILAMAAVLAVSFGCMTTTPAMTGSSGATGETDSQDPQPTGPAPYVPQLEISHSSQFAVVIETGRKRLLYDKAAGIRMNIPAASKMMTAYIACMKLPLQTMVTVSKVAEASEISFSSPDGVKIRSGNKYSLEYLLLRLIFYNSDAAAIAIAEQISGIEEKFVELMNIQAENLGLTETLFANCTGQIVYTSGQTDATADPTNAGNRLAQYTTPLELAQMIAAAYGDPTFARLISLPSEFVVMDSSSLVSMNNTLKSIWTLSEEKITGAFYSELNGSSFMASIGKMDSMSIVIVTAFGNPQKKMTDLQSIISGFYGYYEVSALVRAGEPFKGEQEVTVDGEPFGLVYKSTLNYIHPTGDAFLKTTYRYNSFGPFRRPIQHGMTVGQVIFELTDGTTIPVDVAPDRQILSRVSILDKLLADLQDNQNLTMVILVAGCLLLLILLYNVIRGIYRFVNLFLLVILEKRSRR